MIRAFGWCTELFNPLLPGRLCRGRERWIEGLSETSEMPLLYRTVMSGAIFSDDSARDAQRGFAYAQINAGRLLGAIFPGASIFGSCEHGDPLSLPAKRLLEEDFIRGMWGGSRFVPAVRWVAQAKPDEVDIWLAGEQEGIAAPQVDAFVITRGGMSDKLIEGLFLLTGYSEPEDRPARKYSPTALPVLLEEAQAVALLHLDKHSPVLALYTRERLEIEELLHTMAKGAGAFPIPFAIPPMLARWDRALYELRMSWNSAENGEFPVPPAEDSGGRWSMRRKLLEEAEARLNQQEEAGEE
jgi:hypothetical protein